MPAKNIIRISFGFGGRVLARENFRREQELLRTLLLDGGAMTRRQLAAQMGLSVESLDKVLAELKEAWDATCGDIPLRCEQGSYILDRSRQSHSSLMRGVLNILYRLKALRQTEIDRIAFILGRMRQTSQTLPSLIEAMACETELGEPDRKTVQGYLDYLVELGAAICDKKHRPHQYRLELSLFDSLSDSELADLYAFVDFTANTDIFSAAGYLLLDSLGDYLRMERGMQPVSLFAYKYNYFGRILDEYVCHELLRCLAERRKIRIVYEGKNYRRYRAQGGGKSLVGKVIIPLRVVYDHQYGRWYLIGVDDDAKDKLGEVYRFERIEETEPLPETVPPAVFDRLATAAAGGLSQAWVVSTTEAAEPVEVVVRFWFDPTPGESPFNFIRARVTREGRWGTIEPESETTFLYKIQITDLSEIRSWLMGFGSSAEVLAPESVRQTMIEHWTEMEKRYGAV